MKLNYHAHAQLTLCCAVMSAAVVGRTAVTKPAQLNKVKDDRLRWQDIKY